MRKVARNFVCPPKNANFAVQKCEKGGFSYPYLPYCMTADSFDLAKSGKFTSGVKTSLVKLVLYPPGGHGLLTIFVTPGVSRTLPVRCRRSLDVVLLLMYL